MQYAAFALLLLCWIVSIHFPPWDTFHNEAPAVAAALLGLLGSCRWSQHTVRVPAAMGVVGLFIAIALAQWGAGQLLYGSDVLLLAIYAIVFASAWLWGYQWVRQCLTERLLDTLSLFMVTVGLVTAFQALVQWFHLEAVFTGWILDGLPDNRPRANIGQPNHVATTLLMASVAAFSLRYRLRTSRVVLWLVLVLLGFAVVLTRSRTALVSATLLTTMYFALSLRSKGLALRPAEAIVWLLLLFGMTWFLPYLNSIITEGFASAGDLGVIPPQLTTPGARALLWRQMIEAILQRPWFGWGLLQIPIAHQAGALVIPGDVQLTYSHNMVLDASAMLGIPIAFAFCGLILGWFLKRAKPICRSGAANTALFMFVPLAVHAQLEFPHAYAYFVVLGGLLLGVIDGAVETPSARTYSVPRKALLAFVVGWSALLVAVTYEYMLVEEDFRVNRFENRNIGQTPVDYNPPDLVLLVQLDDMLHGMRLRALPGMSQEDVNILVKISKRYSWAQMQFRTALALGLNGRPEEATEQLKIIKALFPADVYEEAKENFTRLSIEKYPELRNVILP